MEKKYSKKLDKRLREKIREEAVKEFGEGFNMTSPLMYRFSKENICMHAECNEHAHRRILYHAWGTIRQVDVCINHNFLHGSCGGKFIQKKEYKPRKRIDYD